MTELKSTVNLFNGIEIDTDSLPRSSGEFQTALATSLDRWSDNGNVLAWLNLPIEKADFVPIAVDAGFIYHHSGEGYLQLVRTLTPDAYVPSYATHYIGAGGVAINEQNELLVVVERYRRDRSRPYYKLPGGALHPSEHIADAVVREIYEETGVYTKFEAVVCFRHWHGYRYDKSDIYFVCRLHPTSHEITIHDGEIDEALWMPVDEYLTSEYVGEFNREIVRAAVQSPGLKHRNVDGYSGGRPREMLFPPATQLETNV
jgi:8-oxo-dGTP pyrophosphatase MutT (NUDIX family)